MCGIPAGNGINSANLLVEYSLNLSLCSLEVEYLKAELHSAQILNNGTF